MQAKGQVRAVNKGAGKRETHRPGERECKQRGAGWGDNRRAKTTCEERKGKKIEWPVRSKGGETGRVNTCKTEEEYTDIVRGT